MQSLVPHNYSITPSNLIKTNSGQGFQSILSIDRYSPQASAANSYVPQYDPHVPPADSFQTPINFPEADTNYENRPVQPPPPQLLPNPALNDPFDQQQSASNQIPFDF